MSAEEAKAVVRPVVVEACTGPLMQLGPTGPRVEMPGTLVARPVYGKVAEPWRREDLPGLLRQRGALPVPAGGPAPA